jgi:glyoxylase-like metal-dependent hydrolase (beta-lactamase superfamily II)
MGKYKFLKLNDGIYSINGTWLGGITFPTTRIFVIRNSDNPEILIVDTGGPGSGNIIFNSMEKYGLNPNNITGIALTHWHSDHTGGLAELINLVSKKTEKKIKIFIHEDDADALLQQKGMFLKIHPVLKLPLFNKPGKLPAANLFEVIKLSSNVNENPLDPWRMDFIHTPGHTPGHTSFLHRDTMSLLSGSGISIFGNKVAGIVPIFYDRDKQIESAHKLAAMEFKYLYPVHFNISSEEILLKDRVILDKKGNLKSTITGTLPIFTYGKKN